MTGRRALWTGIVVLFAVFAVSGPVIIVRDAVRAGGDGEAAAAEGEGEGAAVTTPTGEPVVVMADLQYQPAALQVAPGTVVVWSNQDVAPHTVTTDSSDSGLINPTESFSMTVQAPLEYFCTLHPSMTARIDVG